MIALANDLDVNSVTLSRPEINNGPVINDNGIDMRNKRITTLADGVDPNDAVNVSQLETATTELKGQIYDIRRDMRRQNKKLSAGIAAAMATAGLPQAYMPGKRIMAVAGATWNGESGLSVGLPTISDNGHWVVKATGNASSRGKYGGLLGGGYQW